MLSMKEPAVFRIKSIELRNSFISMLLAHPARYGKE